MARYENIGIYLIQALAVGMFLVLWTGFIQHHTRFGLSHDAGFRSMPRLIVGAIISAAMAGTLTFMLVFGLYWIRFFWPITVPIVVIALLNMARSLL